MDEMMEFLEKTLPQIITAETKALYATSLDNENNDKTVYYKCSSTELLMFLGSVLYDLALAFIEENKDKIKEILESEE